MSIYLAIELSLREISYILDAVGMRNAKLGNHLKFVSTHRYAPGWSETVGEKFLGQEHECGQQLLNAHHLIWCPLH